MPGVKAPNCAGVPSVSESVAGTEPPTWPGASESRLKCVCPEPTVNTVAPLESPTSCGAPAPTPTYLSPVGFGIATVALTFAGTSTSSTIVPLTFFQPDLTVPRCVHAEPLTRLRLAFTMFGGAIFTVAAPGLVTLTPSSDSTMSTMPHEPQPCDSDSLLDGLHGHESQPGFHCSHMNVPC